MKQTEPIKPHKSQFEDHGERPAQKRGLAYALVLACFFLLIGSISYVTSLRMINREWESKQEAELHSMVNYLDQKLSRVETDLLYFSENEFVSEYLKSPNAEMRAYLLSFLKVQVQVRGVYDQLRILNADGLEVLRVNLSENGKAQIVPPSQLQNKSQRYYFQDTMKKNPGELYTSRFDLNVEHNKVEVPFKPTIRLGQVISDSSSGKLGIILVNFLGMRLLEGLKALNIHDSDQIFLVNDEGYYLMGPTQTKEWGFMIPERKTVGFFSDFKEEWKQIRQKDAGKFSSSNGNFFFRSWVGWTASPLKLVMYQSKSFSLSEERALNWTMGVLLPVFLPLLMILGYKLGYSQKIREAMRKNLEFRATRDFLTGLWNRETILELLARESQQANRRKNPLTISFIDVDGLKETNDVEGHEAGDRLICIMGRTLEQTVRNTDLVARLGGDEFLVVLPDCPEEQAKRIMERASHSFSQEGIKSKGSSWTFSFGLAEWQGQEDTLDTLISRADTLMYQHKKGKKGIK